VVSQELPGDDFSRSQWQLGLNYYRRRISDIGFKGGVLLDIGCGSGNWSVAAASDFRLVIGCDNFIARLSCGCRMRDFLESRNTTFLRGDATALPLESASVDWCLVYNVLPYVRRWREVVPELARVIRPEGKVFAGWVDAGMILFSLAEGLVLGRPRRLIEVLWMVGGKTLRRMGADPNRGQGFLSRNDVVGAFARSNFDLLASTWARDSHRIERGLFPNTFALLPFFHEAVFAKRLAASST
jgi:SAM-dependent methyltransferase